MNLDLLLRDFQQLPVPNANQMSTIAIAGLEEPRVYLGKTHDSRAAFLVERPSGLSVAGSDIGQVRVSPHKWIEPGEEVTRQALVVTLLARDPAVLRGFLIAGIGFIPEIRKVDDQTALRYLEELAAALHAPAARELSIRGLWAELFFMRAFQNYNLALTAWQRSLKDRFDFAVGPNRFEVKSFSGAERILKFRHQQTYAPDGQILEIVSMRLQESAAGVSLEDLADEVVNGLSEPAERVRILRAVDQVVGDQGANREVLFDPGIADESIGITQADSLPRLPQELPDGVRDVHLDICIEDSNVLVRGIEAVRAHIQAQVS